MNWEAANAPKREKRTQEGEVLDSPTKPRRSTETVEAVLSRISKAYTTSMECIGALNKTSRMLQKQTTTTISDESVAVLERVSNAARSTLETAILMDPLVVPHAPTLRQTMQDFSETSGNNIRWESFTEQRPIPPVLSSAAHKSTIRDLAYLSLVNYSDLLLGCCLCGESSNQDTILDRGVVQKVKILADKNRCCWNKESKEDTMRLAVTALCDASNLDGSDPTMWLKLACAARALERIVCRETQSTILWTKYRRLQRYALERGSQALPPNMPPNRTILKALSELSFDERELQAYHPNLQTGEHMKLVLELPRYSWSMLGRMLVRACREGGDFHNLEPKHHHHQHHSSSNADRRKPSCHFGSPVITMNLSPMLVLPSKVLGRICQYLTKSSIFRFEATCRALSVSIISARASMEEETTVNRTRTNNASANDTARQADELGKKEDAEQESKEKTSKAHKAKEGQIPKESHRTSKRLQSQLITSGKKNDRESKRKSFDYCFLASTMSCTIERHRENMKKLEGDKTVSHLFKEQDMLFSPTSKMKVSYRKESDQEAKERLGDSSLSSFVERWSNRNSGPMDLLMSYLTHLSMNVADVFASDPGGTMVLTSCVLGCFELCIRRSGCHQGLAPRFYRSVKSTGSIIRTLELFAVDLFHAELILRQCDRYSPSHVEFDDDSNLISLMVPELLDACEELEKSITGAQETTNANYAIREKFTLLKTRCYWLVAGFYLWRSRISRIIIESRESEDEGIAFIEETAKCFDSPFLRSARTLQTPHLVSPGRTEPHWKEISPGSLSKFRDEIQASSVVSHARQKFQHLVASIDRKEGESAQGAVSEDDAKALTRIGATLFERYKSPYGDSAAKHTELVEDFLAVHGNELLVVSDKEPDDSNSKEQGTKVLKLIPLGMVTVQDLLRMSNPSILTMLITCLQVNSMHQYHVAELLIRLVLTAQNLHKSLLEQISETKAMRRSAGSQTEDAFSDSDDDSVSSDDASVDRNTANKNADEKRARQCGHLVKFFVDCLCSIFHTMKQEEKDQIMASDECDRMIRVTLELSSEWFQRTIRPLSAPDDSVDQGIFKAARSLVRHFCASASATNREHIERLFFRSMVRTIVSHRQILDSMVHSQVDRAGRSARQRLCLKRAEYIGLVARELGYMLSQHLGEVQSLRMSKSKLLICTATKEKSDTFVELSSGEFTTFFDAILGLWKYASQPDTETTAKDPRAVCSSFDRPIVKELRVSVATVVVGLCGSATSTRESTKDAEESRDNASNGDLLCLTEFFDSDASANDWLSDSEGEVETDKQKRKELLRAICHAVHCTNHVIETIDDKEALSKFAGKGHGYEYGPLLPLVTTRVLNYFADSILLNFDGERIENKKQSNLWSDEYPFSARTTGNLLDSILHKTYRWMYGFALVGENEKNIHHTVGKDPGGSLATAVSDLSVKSFLPESTTAAAQLYRCIVRAYACGRRSPPKSALELVSSALPPLQESARSKALKSFMFSTDGSYPGLEDVTCLVRKQENWNHAFGEIHNHLRCDSDTSEDMTSGSPFSMVDEAMEVRRGISSQLARGPLPVVSDSSKNKSEAGVDEERASAITNEEEMSKKFFAILDDLCLGEINNIEGWYRASQCLTMKAELIADRLGLSKGFARSTGFSIPSVRPPSKQSLSVIELEAEQERQAVASGDWIHWIGQDLSFCIRYLWSSFLSLQECSAEIGEKGYINLDIKGCRDSDEKARLVAWRKFESLYQSEDYVGWQEAWGGIFVDSLRKLSLRFMCTAMYILNCKDVLEPKDKVLMSEVSESLAIALYTDLMASQNYGYPMHEMTLKRKRDLANAAKSCFQAAADTVDDPSEKDDNSQNKATWDLLFMIGKCNEKIAGTYRHETYSVSTHELQPRMYEKYMASAIGMYSTAYEQAKSIENDGGFIVDQSGGSSHGSTELLYRMLASRLKCLILSASQAADDLEQAEAEALRLTERHWFKKPEDTVPKELHTRDRIWTVLSDVVTGLAQCRVEQAFFHRSVYRYAQALMWAPVLYDPNCTEGSLGTVPATRSYQIRGLNNSTHAANSAEVIMSSLFDKKRSQLCAVWVTTTTSPSPFQILNNSTRKYDSLRGKYVAAYIETLRLCHRRSELEIFLKWTSTSRRDLPSYFQASASAGGNTPSKPHTLDQLLVMGQSLASSGFLLTAMRQTNSAFADVILHEISQSNTKSIDKKKMAENCLKDAYACFLRLHCSKEDLQKSRAWKYGSDSIREVDALCQAYLVLGEEKNLGSDFGDWSGGARKSAIFSAALEKSQSLFPSLSGYFFTKKASGKTKKGNTSSDPDPAKGKRKGCGEENATTKVSFEVAVPKELVAGGTFLTTVKVGTTTQKVKLKVPEGSPSTLRFTLQVPKESAMAEKKKKAKLNDD